MAVPFVPRISSVPIVPAAWLPCSYIHFRKRTVVLEHRYVLSAKVHRSANHAAASSSRSAVCPAKPRRGHHMASQLEHHAALELRQLDPAFPVRSAC